MIRLTLPFPPSVNCLFPGTTRRFPSPAYKRWRRHADAAVLASKAKPVRGAVTITIDLVPPDKRRRDADNYSKAVVDQLVRCELIEGDDSRFVASIQARWATGTVGAHVTIMQASGEMQDAA